MVHDLKTNLFLSLKSSFEKIWLTQKCSQAEKLTSQKKLVETNALTGCKGASPYMASQEMVLRLRARCQKQNGTLASKLSPWEG